MLRKASTITTITITITITVTTDGPWISFKMPATGQPAGLEPPQSVQSTWPLAPESSTPDWPAPLRLRWAWTLATLHDWTPWPVRTAKGCRRTRLSRCKQRHPLRFCRSSPSSSPPPSPLPVPALDDLPSPSDQSQGLPGLPPPPSAPSAAAALLFFASAAFFPPFIPLLARPPACSRRPPPAIQSPPVRSCSNFLHGRGQKHFTPFSVRPEPSTRLCLLEPILTPRASDCTDTACRLPRPRLRYPSRTGV
ncbi:hypothetical protein ACHAPV_007736 [Trichoderma viride]